MFLKISQNSLKNICDGVSFIIMLRAVASVSCQEYIKDKILTHVLAFPLFLFCFLSQCSDLLFENFILYINCGVDIRTLKKPLRAADNFCQILHLRCLTGF